ncbi:MAG: hypothetical protein WC476_05225 [Phycisphaerae bacterium]|jgi:hypothetical protein
MKKLMFLLLFFSMVSAVTGEVLTRVCEADGHTPFDGRDIMVGTKLTVLVGSSVAEYWWGGALVLEEANMINIGYLYGRDCNGPECPGSCLPAAGEFAYAGGIEYPGIGFEFYGGEEPSVGDWFILDYNVLGIGDCNIVFYNYDVNEIEPVNTLTLRHVRTRDFNRDTIVDSADLYILTSYWLSVDCNEPDWCEGTDLDTSHNVDFSDFALFCNYWLEATMYSFSLSDFNKDTRVDFTDFTVFASYWGATDCIYPGCCQGTDLDTDGNIDFSDLSLFVDHWLEGTE